MAGISGTIYAPVALLHLTGDATLNAALVVNELTLSGDAGGRLSADGSSSRRPICRVVRGQSVTAVVAR
jgi:hypothetical protein